MEVYIGGQNIEKSGINYRLIRAITKDDILYDDSMETMLSPWLVEDTNLVKKINPNIEEEVAEDDTQFYRIIDIAE